MRNEGGYPIKSLRIKLVGTKSNRNGIGAVVRVTSGGVTQWSMCAAAPATFRQRTILTFGWLASKADAVEVRWPSGQSGQASGVPVDSDGDDPGGSIAGSRAHGRTSH